MKPIRAATSAAGIDRGVTLDCGHGITCRVSVLKPDLFRVLFLRHGVAPQRTWMVPAEGAADAPWEGRDRTDESAWGTPAFRVEHAEGEVVVSTDAMCLEIAFSPFAMTWSLPDGTVFARDRPTHAYMFGQTEIRHACARDPADAFHGLGDKTGPLDLHGRRLRTTMMDSLGVDPERGDPLYKHWPFLIAKDAASGVSYGTFYDNFADASFDLGAEHDNYYGLYRSYSAAGGDLDLYMTVGPRLADVTPKFLALTGRTALPPRWSLGFAQTAMAIADSDNAQERIEAFIARCAAEDIPVSAFHFGSGYTSIGPKRYVFNWNRAKFPDPDGLMLRFRDAGMRIVANIKPCLLDDHPRYGEPLAAGAFVNEAGTGTPALSQFWDGEGAHIDFTNPDGIAWWQRGLSGQVLATGIDAAWNDNNEYGFWNDGAMCAGFGDPIPLDLARPLQPLLMTRASLERQRAEKPGERQFTVTRAGCPGIQRYGQTWSGDNASSWHCLKWNLRMGLTMSLSGMLNIGHDVGGFSGPVPDAELLVRWTQAGVLHPRFIMNSWKPDGVYTSPWLHPEATPLIRDAIRLRYRLMPYLYSLMHAAHDTGEAPLRPLCAAFEDDAEADALGNTLMLGPFLLACPVTQPGERDVWLHLPAGPECWFDFYTGEQLEAGEPCVVSAPLDRLPLVVPAGTILPMTDPGEDYALLHDEPSRLVRIFPGPGEGESAFTLVEDDGLTEGGPVTRLRFSLAWTPDSVTLRCVCEGEFVLGFARVVVAMPRADRRGLTLECEAAMLGLAQGSFRL